MSMFTVTGQVVNIFKTPEATNKDGESYGGDYKIQLLGELPLPNGETRHEMIDLKVHDVDVYKPYLNKRLTVPVGSLALAKNKLVHFIPKGSAPLTGA
ncbi:MAG: hypothetical protein ACQ5SW_11650 [Sphaerochaetaceae bacterium]